MNLQNWLPKELRVRPNLIETIFKTSSNCLMRDYNFIFHLMDLNHRLRAGPLQLRTRDFTTDFTSSGSQNIARRFCRVRCVNGLVKLSENLRRNGGLYRARCTGPIPCAYVLGGIAEVGPVQRHAAHQRPLIVTDPDGVPWVAQALPGKMLLGQRLCLNHLGKCHWRYHHAVFFITVL